MGQIQKQVLVLWCSLFLMLMAGCASEQVMMEEEVGDTSSQAFDVSISSGYELEAVTAESDKHRVKRRQIHAWDEVLQHSRFPDTFFKHYGVNPIDNFISKLRKKLAWTPSSRFRFATVRGIGYRMEVED